MKALILASLSALTLFAVTACDSGGAGPESSGDSEQPASMSTTPTPETETDTAQ